MLGLDVSYPRDEVADEIPGSHSRDRHGILGLFTVLVAVHGHASGMMTVADAIIMLTVELSLSSVSQTLFM